MFSRKKPAPERKRTVDDHRHDAAVAIERALFDARAAGVPVRDLLTILRAQTDTLSYCAAVTGAAPSVTPAVTHVPLPRD